MLHPPNLSLPRDPFASELPSRQREIEVEDLRMAWRDACADARLAYLTWRETLPARRPEAYSVYVAAADREATAADTYSRAAGTPALAA
jgi:hypothetical protein